MRINGRRTKKGVMPAQLQLRCAAMNASSGAALLLPSAASAAVSAWCVELAAHPGGRSARGAR